MPSTSSGSGSFPSAYICVLARVGRAGTRRRHVASVLSSPTARLTSARSDDLRGLGTGSGHRTCSGRDLRLSCRCRCSLVTQRHAHPPRDRNRLRPSACSRERGGVVLASRERVWCIPCTGSRQPGHDRCRAFAPPPGQEISARHRYPRVLMTWSYAGLVAAGCGQLTVAVGPDVGAWVVPVAIGTVLSSAASSSSGECRHPLIAC
jgi:hypothetical protein